MADSVSSPTLLVSFSVRSDQKRWARRLVGEDDLAEDVALVELRECRSGVAKREGRVDRRLHAVLGQEVEQRTELGLGAHRRAENLQLEEERPLQLQRGDATACRAAYDDSPAWADRLQRVTECRVPDGLDDG